MFICFGLTGVTVDRRKRIMRSCTVCTPYQTLWGHQAKDNDTRRTNGTYGKEDRYIRGLGETDGQRLLEGSGIERTIITAQSFLRS
jgi:hypothetical protein